MNEKKALVYLHISVFLLGFTGVIGKLIDLGSVNIVWLRIAYAVFSMFLYLLFKNENLIIFNLKNLIYLSIVSLVLTSHWLFFYESIKVSNVTTTLVGLSLYPMFTALIEPLYFKGRFKTIDIVLSFIIVLALLLCFPQFDLSNSITYGLILSIIGALLASIYTIMNRKLTQQFSSFVVSYYQLLFALFFISLYQYDSFDIIYKISFIDHIYLAILGIICTSFTHTITIHAMKKIEAFVVSLVTNLEPVYGIILALIIFNQSEYMTANFYLGSIIILVAVFSHPFLKKRFN